MKQWASCQKWIKKKKKKKPDCGIIWYPNSSTLLNVPISTRHEKVVGMVILVGYSFTLDIHYFLILFPFLKVKIKEKKKRFLFIKEMLIFCSKLTCNWFFFSFIMSYPSTIQDHFSIESLCPKIWNVMDQTPRHTPALDTFSQSHII